MSTPYYPETIEGRADWWQNKIDKIGIITALDAEAAPAILEDAKMAVYLYRTLPGLYDTFVVQVHGYINSYLTGAVGTPAPKVMPLPAWPAMPVTGVVSGIEGRRVKWVPVLKNSTGYEPTNQGVALLLESVGGAFQPDSYKAEIVSVESLAVAQVMVKFRKARGAITGMAFNGRKTGTGTFLDLGRFTVTPASLHIPIGTPGQAELWEIQGQAFKGDTLIGTPSSISEVLVRG